MTKVLVVDDTPDMAKLLARTVAAEGYEASVASNGRDALHAVSHDRFDAILLDVMMPGMTGLEVLRRLKADDDLASIPVIMVTAKGEDSDIIEGLNAGAHDYVTKPFKRDILAARMRAAIDVKRTHDRLVELNKELAAEIQERKRMQQELLRAQKMEAIGLLAAGIAHEINTPAQYIGDNTRFLRDIFSDVDGVLRDMEKLLHAAKQGHVSDDLIKEVEQTVHDADVDYIKEEVPRALQQSLEGIEGVAKIVRAMKEFSHPGGDQRQTIDLNRAIESTLTVSRNQWKYVAEVATEFDNDLPPYPASPETSTRSS